jgi:hypothetical protein
VTDATREDAPPDVEAACREIEALGVRTRLEAFVFWTAVTAQAAFVLAENGDEKAKDMFTHVAGLLEQVRSLLSHDPDPDRARELLERAEAGMTELTGYMVARQREFWPDKADEVEKADAERVDQLVKAAPPIVAARIQARRNRIDAATRRHTAGVSLVPVLLDRAHTVAREVRPRRRDGRASTGERSPPRLRPGSADSDDDLPDLAPPEAA